VRLKALELHSPEAEALRAALAPLIADPRITVIEAEAAHMRATLATPSGEVVTL
jgi:hypothetical protein